MKALEPWKDLWDMDLIALRFGDDEEPVFMSVLGRGSSCIYYRQKQVKVDFEHGECFVAELEKGKVVSGTAEPLPFQAYQFGVLQIDDKLLQKKLKKMKKNGMVLEVDVQYLGSGVKDEEFGRPRHPQLCAMCDSTSGMMLAADLTEVALEDVCKLAGVHRYFI